jgi:hypothetical protein
MRGGAIASWYVEYIIRVEAWDSWDTGGERRSSDKRPYTINRLTEWTSPSFSVTWVTNRLPRYANVKLYNADGRVCTDEIRF